MSMEQAILAHAAALTDLAAAIRAMGNFVPATIGTVTETITLPADAPTTSTVKVKGNTAAEDTAKVKADKKPGKADTAAESGASSDTAGAASSDAATEVVKQVSAEIEAKGTVEAGAADPVDEAKTLDYANDVRPVLLAAIKKGKRPDIEAYLAKVGLAKAELAAADQLPAMLAFAKQLAA